MKNSSKHDFHTQKCTVFLLEFFILKLYREAEFPASHKGGK